jgi:hypothetical protein
MKNDPKDDFRKDDFSAIGSSDGSFSLRSRAAANRLRNQSRSRLSRVEIRASAHACDGAVGAHVEATRGRDSPGYGAKQAGSTKRVPYWRRCWAVSPKAFNTGDLLEGKAILDELA